MTMAKRTPEDVDHKARGILVKMFGDYRTADGSDKAAVVPANLGEDATLESFDVDSLDRVELVMAYEEEFGIEITDEDAEAWKTVGDVIGYLQKAGGGQGGGEVRMARAKGDH